MPVKNQAALPKLPWVSFPFKGYKPLRFLSDSEDNCLVKVNSLYRYLSEDAFKATLHNGFRFVEPSQWPDKFESRFYQADFTALKYDPPKILYASCFTSVKNNEAAWKAYLKPVVKEKCPCGKVAVNRSPEDILCFRLKINRKLLREALRKCKDFDIYEAPVVYLSEYTIRNMHRPGIPGAKSIHNAFFGKGVFSLDSYLSLLLLKRDTFAYEHEVRYFVVPKDPDHVPNEFYLVNAEINFKGLVEEIFVARPYGSFKLDDNELKGIIAKYGIEGIKVVSGDIYEDSDSTGIKIELKNE